MFDPSDLPRVFGLPPGADFPSELAAGILRRLVGATPDALARVTILVNTHRMQRRLTSLFASGPARLLPRIRLVTETDALLPDQPLPALISPLRRRLELIGLVERLLDQDPSLAPRSAAVDLADSLAALMDEMQGEGVPLEALTTLETGDLSGHWDRSLAFLGIVGTYIEATGNERLDSQARLRLSTERLIATWADTPPRSPVILAGSTGSRATTALLIEAVARLPQGAVVLPGFDFHLPSDVWASLPGTPDGISPQEDHPQHRFAALLSALDLDPSCVPIWSGDETQGHRNALISLSLRPAPVTDQWLTEGPALSDLRPRTKGLALIEAPHPKDEATAIAVAIRQAVEASKSVALITPDRTLGRRVAAALARWDIVADDSAGRPLSLTAPGRFLRQVAGLIGRKPDPVDLVAALKHPLTQSGSAERGPHLLATREFELFLRRQTLATVTPEVVTRFREKRPSIDGPWCDWLFDWLTAIAWAPAPTLEKALDHHIHAAEVLAAGGLKGAGALWDRTAGRDMAAVIDRFRAEAEIPGSIDFIQYRQLFERVLAAESTRNFDTARPDVMIWGTLEARVQGAEVVILGGLNEGVWPEQPPADPWLNRRLRREAGLLMPDRLIGLAAHDFQQAVAANEVILSRAKRNADSETVPSRWISRLTNLLSGLPDQHGPDALSAMRLAGQTYVDLAARLDQPLATVKAAPRPAPSPPRNVRPKQLVITDIQRLIRDPYAIYAKYILGLRALDPLVTIPDARIRGTVFHRIVEDVFTLSAECADPVETAARLRQAAERHLSALPWPGVAAHWIGHIDAIADQLADDEAQRRASGRPIALECAGEIQVPDTRLSVRGKADRIDRLEDGRLAIYDYKSGSPIAVKQIRHFDRQLPIEAVMAELGGFREVVCAPVALIGHIGLGRSPKTTCHDMGESDDIDLRTETIKAELALLLNSFDSGSKGYPSRRAMEKQRFEGDYDHLARFGEWDGTDEANVETLP